MKSLRSNDNLSSQHKSNLQVLGKHSGQGCDVWGTAVHRPSWPDGCQVARLPQANTQAEFLPTILLPLIPFALFHVKYRICRGQKASDQAEHRSPIQSPQCRAQSNSGDAKRSSIFKSSAIVTCEGRLLQRVLLVYFFVSIFSPLNICTLKDWCMNASVPLNWTEASHWDRANMEGSRCRNINQQFVISILTSDFSECINLIIRGQRNHEDI